MDPVITPVQADLTAVVSSAVDLQPTLEEVRQSPEPPIVEVVEKRGN